MRSVTRHFTDMIARTGIALLVYSLCRILFYTFNATLFEDVKLIDFLHGVRFDISAVFWLFSPFIFLSALPLNVRFTGFWQALLKILFHIANSFSVILNTIDIEYFRFTLKRSGIETFKLLTGGDDIWALLPAFLADFWYLVLTAIALTALSEYLYRKTQTQFHLRDFNFSKVYYLGQIALFIITAALFVTGARGGFQLTPLSPVDAGIYTPARNTPVVLNTPFVFIKSLNREIPEQVDFMTRDEAEKLIGRTHVFGSDRKTKPNVVILIMESFSNEHIGYFNNGEGVTPVFDSILRQSLAFDRCFANGKKSIEGLPAILSSVPSLMNTPYISSPFSTNNITSIAHKLKLHGYGSSFYHGGKNGTMGFDSFTRIAGFDRYAGKDEYPHIKRDYDGHWGIFDEPFFRFYADELSRESEPFLSVFFSLSSHHPYTVPEEHREQFPEGESKIKRSIRYADYALGVFFEQVSSMPWFDNTLFVLTADHTAALETPEYKNRAGQYRIPLAFFAPGDTSLNREINNRVTQQIDIMPSVLDYINLGDTVFAFGQSVFGSSREYAVNYFGETYQWIEGDYLLQHDFQDTPRLYNYIADKRLRNNIAEAKPERRIAMTQRLKAFVQLYNEALITNSLNEIKDE